MSEHVHDYPMAVTAAGGPDRTAVPLAVEWLRRTTDDVGGQPLVFAPNRRALREWPILTGLSGWVAVTTWRSLGRGGPDLCHDSYCNRNAAHSANTPNSSMGKAGSRPVSR